MGRTAAYRVKERLRFCRCTDLDRARAVLAELQDHCTRREISPERRSLGHTIGWFEKICDRHVARMSNGRTEGLNDRIKRIKRMDSATSRTAGLRTAPHG